MRSAKKQKVSLRFRFIHFYETIFISFSLAWLDYITAYIKGLKVVRLIYIKLCP